MNGKKFYPMIRKATESDPTYEPYYVPLKDVVPTKADNSVIAPVENGSTASQAYAVGEHFIRDRAFCTCKQPISQGGSFTLGTNYTAGDVAGCLSVKYSAITSSNPSISINPLSKVIKSGNIAEVILVFNVNSSISTFADICNLPFEPYMTDMYDNTLFALKTLAAPFSDVGYSLYSTQDGLLRINPGDTPLPAGDYYVTGTYICK
jgi:hypothetical protein